jgi:hypothetical protein
VSIVFYWSMPRKKMDTAPPADDSLCFLRHVELDSAVLLTVGTLHGLQVLVAEMVEGVEVAAEVVVVLDVAVVVVPRPGVLVVPEVVPHVAVPEGREGRHAVAAVADPVHAHVGQRVEGLLEAGVAALWRREGEDVETRGWEGLAQQVGGQGGEARAEAVAADVDAPARFGLELGGQQRLQLVEDAVVEELVVEAAVHLDAAAEALLDHEEVVEAVHEAVGAAEDDRDVLLLGVPAHDALQPGAVGEVIEHLRPRVLGLQPAQHGHLALRDLVGLGGFEGGEHVREALHPPVAHVLVDQEHEVGHVADALPVDRGGVLARRFCRLHE